MKTKILPLVCFIFILIGGMLSVEAIAQSDAGNDRAVTIYSTPSMIPLTTQWAAQYQSSYPDRQIKVVNLQDPGMTEKFGLSEDMCFGTLPDELLLDQGAYINVVVGREIVVPVISKSNPFLNEIGIHGVTQTAFAKSAQSQEHPTWGELLNMAEASAVTFYIPEDPTVQAMVSLFLEAGKAGDYVVTVKTTEELFAALQRDPNGIGFCRINDIIDPSASAFIPSLTILPIDKNGNGKMDYMEQIYETPQDFFRGVWIGKYPRTLVQNLYGMVPSQSMDPQNMAFLEWILSVGQASLSGDGYSALLPTEAQAQLNKLQPVPLTAISTAKSYSAGWLLLYIFLGLIVAITIIRIGLWIWKSRKSEERGGILASMAVFDENSIRIPGGLFFDKTHTWAFMEQDGAVKVGVDDFLQHVVGSLTRIELKKTGDRIRKGDLLCTLVQEGKRLNIFSPVTGRVEKVNEQLDSHLSAFNESPYTEGWLYRIVPDNWTRELSFLSMGDTYKHWLSTEFSRLKDFLGSIGSTPAFPAGSLVLQEGGQLKDHVLADLGPAVWEEFQMNFIQKTN